MGGNRMLLGRWGEARVADDLRARGHRLIAAGWQCRFGEVDLITSFKSYLIFTEVKLRKNANFAQAREFVNGGKQRRLRTCAELYLVQHPTELQPRFDVAEIYAPNGMETIAPNIQYIENAF